MAHQQNKLCPVCKQIFRARKDAVTCSARCRKRLHRAKLALEREAKAVEHSVESAVEAGEKALENLGSAIVEELAPSIATEEGYVATPTLATSPTPIQPTIPASTPVAAPTAPVTTSPAPSASAPMAPVATAPLAETPAPPLASYLQDTGPVSASTAALTPSAPVVSTAALSPLSSTPIAPAPAPLAATDPAPTPAIPVEPKVEDLPAPTLETVDHNAGDVFNPGGNVTAAPIALQPEETLDSTSANPVSSVLSSTATPLAEAPVSAIQQNLTAQPKPKRDYLGTLKQAVSGRVAVYTRAAAFIAIVSIGYFGFSSLFHGAKPPTPVSSSVANSANVNTVLPTNSNGTSIQFNRATSVARGNSLTATGQVTFKNNTNSVNAFNLQDASGTDLINADTVNGTVTIKGLKVNGNLVSTGSVQLGSGTSLNASSLVINSTTVCTSQGCAFNLPLQLTQAGNIFNAPNSLIQLNGQGQIPDSLLGPRVAFLDNNQTFTGDNTFTGKVVFQNAVNGSSNFEIQKADGTGDLFMVDTSSGKIGIGRAPLSTTAAILQVNGSIDLTGQVTFNGNQINTLNLSDSSNIARLNANQTFTGNNTFSGNLLALNLQPANSTLTIGSTSATLALQGNLGSQLIASNGTFNTTIGFSGTPTGNVNYSFDASASPGDYTICTTVGNCVGAGGAVDTPGGNSGYLAKFTGTETIADSSILDNGLTVTVGLPTVLRASSNSATAFRVQNANGLIDLLVADTLDSRVGISLNTGNVPQYPLDVAGDINSSSGLRVGGNLVCTSTGCGAGSGSGFYIQNGTAVQGANFNIQSTAIGSVVAVIQGASGQTADLFDVYDGSSNKVLTVNNTGSVLVKPSTNSTTAFQIQNAAGNSNLFIADTADSRVGINNANPGYALDVNGDVNISNGSFYRINGVSICGPQATCAPTAGSSFYIQNSTSLQTGANFFISSANINNAAGILRGALGQVADILDLQDGNGNNIFTESAGGSVLAQTTTNSTTAFQVQNSSGQAVFLADTVNNQVGINTSTPTATLSVSGTGLIQATSATNPTLTVSGNEVTDVTRTTGTQGDGRAAPDSSYGIWEGTTNMLKNGGAETNTTATGVWSTGTTTVTRDTTGSKFGSASFKVVTDGTASNQGISWNDPANSGSKIAVSANTTYTFSVWIKGTTGTEALNLGIAWYDSSNTAAGSNSNNLTATTGWSRYTLTATAPSNAAGALVRINNQGTSAYTLWVDGAQLEQKAYATPYVETNGATATRSASRVQAPASLLNSTQGWAAIRVRMDISSSTGAQPDFLSWVDNTNNRIEIAYNTKWELVRTNGTYTNVNINGSFNPGEIHTIVAAWTATQTAISIDGSPFTTFTGTQGIPNIASSTFDIGRENNGAAGYIDSDILWTATGTGTLTNADASNIYGFGNTDPGFSNFPGYSTPTMIWQGNTSSYINSSNSSPLVFNVANSSGQSLFSVDDNLSAVNLQAATNATSALIFGGDSSANLYRLSSGTIATSGSLAVGTNISVAGTSTLTGNLTSNGTALFKDTTNSTTAFQIQNSTSNTLLVADTVNGRIGIGTSSPTATLAVNGTGLFQATAIGTANTMTVSGNEITDATRTTNTQGDGRAAPDSSYGIWEGTTNIWAYGGMENDVTNYGVQGSGISKIQDSSTSKFGSYSMKITTPGNGSGEGYDFASSRYPAVTASTTYTASAWFYAPAGENLQLILRGLDSSKSTVQQSTQSFTTTGSWQRISVTTTMGASAAYADMLFLTNGTHAYTFWLDGVQLEQKPYATPYVETNGTTASRSTARVQGTAAAANITGTQGWVALRVRMPNSPTSYSSLGANSPRFWAWGTSYQDFQLYVNTAYNGTIGFSRDSGRTGGVSVNSATAWVNPGDYVTVIAAWDANNVYISTNGSAFISGGGNGIPPSLPSTFDIGSLQGTSEVGGEDLWFAAGNGSLTNTDASNINSFGNTDPNMNSFSSSASASFVWQANNATYSYSGYQPIVFQVQNSSGSQLLGVDANASAVLLPNATSASAALILGGDSNVNLYRSAASTLTTSATFQSSALQSASLDTQTATALNIGTTNATAINLNQNTIVAAGKSLTVNGTVLAQNSTDSTNAFGIQNAAGTSNLFIADTADSRLGIGTATPLSTFNVSGSSLFQGASSSANNLTLSGNEITDATRAVGQQGDGRSAPDSSYGVWEGTTNLVPNGGFETNATGTINNQSMTTINRTTSQAKFGSASVNTVGTGSGTQSVEWRDLSQNRIAATAGNTYTFSLWQESASNYGLATALQLVWYDGSGNQISSVNTTVASATTSWGRVSATQTAPANTASVRLIWLVSGGTIGNSYFFDGVQFEQKATATPYVETNGATASRSAARVQAPSSLMNATQGWFAVRVSIPWAYNTTPLNYATLLEWGVDNNNKIELLYNNFSGCFNLARYSGGTPTQQCSSAMTFAANTTHTIVGYWTASSVGVSVDGSSFLISTGANIPNLSSATQFDIGTGGTVLGNRQFDSNFLWTAIGTGTLTNTDASNINAFGNTDPYTTNFSQAAYPTMVWHANNGTYQTGNSVALQVQNSSGANLLAVDSANSAIKVQASAKFQNLTDSTNALTVANAAGTQLFNVNTSNLQVSVANLQSSGSVNIVNPQGSISLSPGISSPNGLTLSGNEITDTERAEGASTANVAGHSYDGKTNDSSTGVWESTTNLVKNGGAETNTNYWSSFANSPNQTLARTTSFAKFGSAALSMTTSTDLSDAYFVGTNAATGVTSSAQEAANAYAVSPNTTYTFSAWLKAPSNLSSATTPKINLRFIGYDSSSNVLEDHSQTVYSSTNAFDWTRFSYTFTTGSSTTKLSLRINLNTLTGTVLADGIQLEQKAIATPYVETNGGTQTRAAARVQAPASALNATQGWVAARVRMGFDSTAAPSSGPQRLFTFSDGTLNNRVLGLYVSGSAKFEIKNTVSGANDVLDGSTVSFSSGTYETAIFAWSASTLYLSVNGSSFSSIARSQGSPNGLNTFDIGTDLGNNPLDSDILWTATGTGTLTASDASTLNSLGNTDPTYASLMSLNKGSAAPTMAWNANTTSYQDSISSNGDSLIYAANTSSTLTGNLLDLQSGSVPSSKFNVDTSGNTTIAGTLSVGGLSTFTGSVLKPVNDSTSAFQIQNAGGSSLFNVDSTNNQISLGAATTLVLGNKSTSGDPANPVNGEIYYNSSLNAFRCYQAGVWVNCTGSGGGGGGGGDVNQGGNTFGANMVIGTNDNYSLSFRTNATNVMTLGTDGSALFQNSTDSPTAFQIQNQAGSSNLFVADTTNSRIGIGTSSPTSTLSVNGSTVIQQSSVTSPTLTVSGNEITDVSRTTNTQGDGTTAPDSSYGIWESTTNILLNGGFESNTANWSSSNGATLTQVTSQHKFGTGSMQIVTPGSVTNEGTTSISVAASPSVTYTGSVWVYAPNGVSLRMFITSRDSSTNTITSTITTFTGTGGWQRVSATQAFPSNAAYATISVQTNTTVATTLYLDGAQVEQKAIATPYVETNGSAQTRSTARVQAPSTLLNSTQGWVAMRLRMPWSYNNAPGSFPGFFDWRTDNNNRLSISYTASSNYFSAESYNAGVDIAAHTGTQSFTAGSYITLVVSWTSTTIQISANGSSFAANSSRTPATLSASYFDIGDLSISNYGDASYLWFAAGTGTLNNTDASNINAFGNTDPSFGSFTGTANPTMTWAANNASYSNSAASSGLVLSLQNSTGTNLLGVDATANQITANTSAVFKNSVNGTGAFQIQNAGGNNLLSVDTTNSLVNLGTPGASGVNGSLVFNSATSGNYSVTLGISSSQVASYSLKLPTAAPTTGQCVQVDSLDATQLDFVTCSGGGGGSTDLQGAYNNSASPATIATTTAGKGIIFKGGTGNDSTTLFQVQNSSGTAVLDVDTTNGRVGIGTNAPAARLDVASGTQTVIRGNSTGSNDILDLASNGTNAFTVGSTGAVLAQNTTDSIGAFKIQNAAGNSNLFVADTQDTRLGIGTATPVATVNVVGSTLIQQGAATNLTVSGNEITDASRTTNTQGDGKTPPDSSYGIWESTTNLVTNGGFESNTTGWSANGTGSSIGRITNDAKFGSSALQLSAGSTNTNRANYTISNPTQGQTYTVSAWVKAANSAAVGLRARIELQEGSPSQSVAGTAGSPSVILTNNWQRIWTSTTIINPSTGTLTAFIGSDAAGPFLDTGWSNSSAQLNIDGVQLEQKAVATPYVETNGSTASRSGSHIQAPSSLLNASQGWVAMRMRMDWAAGTRPAGSFPGLFRWYDNSSQNGLLFFVVPNGTSNNFEVKQVVNNVATQSPGTSLNFASGDYVTAVFAWSGSNIAISINGSSFVNTTTPGPITSALQSTFDIGTGDSQFASDADYMWFATGTGTLSNTDASNINAFGNTDPGVNSFSGSANPSMVWKANNSAYNTSSNADVAFQVNNSAGSSLLSLDATNAKLTVNTSGLFQNTTNSANALTVNNASGTQLFNVNTSNLQVTASNLQSSGAVNLVNSNGTVSLAGGLQSINTLTTSGNEITDASRTTNTQGDGRAAPDSSYGIWESTTNLVKNGGFETGVSNTGQNNAVVSSDTTIAKFGAASAKIVANGVGVGGLYGTYAAGGNPGSRIPISANQTYTESAWIYATSAITFKPTIEWYDNTNTLISSSAGAFQTTNANSWTRVTATGTAPSNAVGSTPTIYTSSNPANGTTWWEDGYQFEQKAIATPYVEANGATASRNAARVQAPATNLNATQGWVAMRVRMGLASSSTPSFNLFALSDGTSNNRISGKATGSGWSIIDVSGGSTVDTDTQTVSYNPGDFVTAVFAYTSSQLAISINGASFTTISRTVIPSGLNSLDIGTLLGTSNFFDGDVLWTAMGSGTLSNTDASTLNGYGNTDPTLAKLYSLNSQAASPTFMWNANTANYQDATSSNGDSLIYAANTTGTTGNLIDVQSGAFPSSRFSVSTTGQTLINTSTNSTTAFQVQNSSGSAALSVDTVNNQVGINTSTPTATLAVNGTGLIQANSTTNPLLTTSGNEITDASRTNNTQGDGRSAPDSSFGIWENTTNLEANGGFESNNTTGWGGFANSLTPVPTLSTDNTKAKFGTYSMKVVTGGAYVREGVIQTITSGISANTTYTFSAWVWAAAGQNMQINIDWKNSGTFISSQSVNFIGNGAWQRITDTGTSPASTNQATLDIYTNNSVATATTFWADGVQMEQKAFATPYVDTSGTVASRNGARIQAPVSSVTATQGWMAVRGRYGFASAQANGERLFWLGDGTTNSINRMAGSFQPNSLAINENSNGGATETDSINIPSWNVGDTYTAILSWTATTISISYNGSTFTTMSRTQVPVGVTTLDIGSSVGNNGWIDGDMLWTAMGTGTLTNTDATNLYALGNTDPGFSTFPGYSLPTLVWQANTASYINNGNTSNLVFNVQNSLGQSLFNVDTNSSSVNLQNATSAGSALTFGNDTLANLYRSTSGTIATSGSLSVAGNISAAGTGLIGGNFTNNGSALFQNSTNSTTAFQIQNAGGTSNLFVADTLNSRIGIGTITPTATLAVNGTGLIQASSATNPTVTVSGNEITDATRTTNTSGDGRTPPDSSYGIWESTTNLVTNGGFESNTNGWQQTNSSAISQDGSTAKFGASSLKVVTPGSVTGEGAWDDLGASAASSSTIYTASLWFKAPVGKTFTIVIDEKNSGSHIIYDNSPSIIATGAWQRATYTFTTTSTTNQIGVGLTTTSTAQAVTFNIDGVQLEQKAMATPYVETNGTTATRNASEVQLPVSVANTTQGWMAMRVRVGFPSTVSPSLPTIFGSLGIDGNNRLQIVWSSGSWSTRRVAGGVQGSVASVTDTFNTGDMRTLILKWDASTISLSVNGSLFSSATTTNGNTFTPTKFDIGSFLGGSNADSDFLWFAAGTGTLSDAEAANMNGFGNTDPGYSSFAGADAATAVWQANNTSYINSSSNSPLAFNVTNSSGSSLFNVDANLGTINLQGATSAASSLIFGNDTAANLYRSTTGTIATSGSLAAAGSLTVNGNAKVQTSVNSTTAFQVQNASSTNLLVADTANSKVGIGAAPSAASAAATFQVSGTASVQTAAAGALTLSGNEITDTRRAEGASATNVAGHSYDGRTNDSSYGIWEGTTNLVSNGGMESNATGWTTAGSNTVARDTTKAKFGSASLKATYQNNIQLALFNNITVTNGQTYTASAWVYVPASYNGTQPQLEIDGGTAVIPLGTRNAWQRVTVTYTATSSTDNLAIVERGTVPTAGQSIYLDGVQVENKAIATPYVETNGSTQTRSSASVKAPASALNATQGWFAARIRMGFSSSSFPSGGASVIDSWVQSTTTDRIYLDVSATGWHMNYVKGNTNERAVQAASFNTGDVVTVVGYWTSTSVGISVNGASFTTASRTQGDLSSLPNTFNVGNQSAQGFFLDGDMLWNATGTGTLTNTDAGAINNFGNSDPDLTSFSSQDSNSVPTLVWKANSGNYQNQLAFSVQNSIGANELGVDVADGSVLFGNATTSASALILGNDANLYRSASQTLKTDGNLTVGTNLAVNGSALLQNATDSTSAFQIKQANGNALFTADTYNGYIGIGTSSPQAALHVYAATAPQIRITDVAGGASGTQSAMFGLATANSQFVSNSSTGDTVLAAKPGGRIILGTSASGSQVGSVFVGTSGQALFQNTTDSATGFQIQNQAGTSNLFVADTLNSKVGINKTPSSTGAALQVGGDVDITGNYKVNGAQISTSNLSDASNIALLNGTGPQTFTGNNKFTGITTFQNASDSSAAVQIQNSAGTSNLFTADTTHTRIAIAQASASYTLDVGGDINTTGIIRINGAQVSTSSLSDGSNIGLLNANNTFSGNNTFTGTVLAKNTSTTAFQIQNAGGTQLLVADTSNMRLYIGNPSGDTTNGTLIVLDNISNAGDPAGINGAMYYNSTTGKFRCYEAGAWTNCIDSSQLAATSGTQAVSSTSYGDVTGLGFSVLATKSYMLQCSLLVSVTGNGGNVSMTGPASPTAYTATFQKTSDQSAGDTFTTSSTYDDGNTATAFRVVTSTNGTNKFILNYNAVLNNGSNAGTWQIRAKAVDGTSSITFYPTSTCTLRPF